MWIPSPQQHQQYSLVIGIIIIVSALSYYSKQLYQIFFEPPHKLPLCVIDKRNTDAVRNNLDASRSAIRIPRSVLEDFIAKLLCSAGALPSHARLVAKVLSYADNRGIPSHGANRVDKYIKDLLAGRVDGTAIPVVEKKTGCCALIDGKNGLGAVTSHLGMKTAINLAKDYGVGIVSCRQSNHFGAAGFYSQLALDEGMIGMSFTNTSPFVVPTGGKTRAVGTNPICFFAPGYDDSFQLDMATSVVPIGKVEVMKRTGRSVPIGWGVDRNGDACSDPAEICNGGGLYPLGSEQAGYKGYGLAMMVEIMSSVLSDAAIGPKVPSRSAANLGLEPINYGHCFVAIDPSRFTPNFQMRLGQYLQTMRSLPGNVVVAGDPEKRYERESGIILYKAVACVLCRIADTYNIVPPSELSIFDSNSAKAELKH